MKIWIGLFLFLAALCYGGYLLFVPNSDSNAHYLTETPAVRDIVLSIAASGVVEPEELINVGAQVAGRILSFGIDEKGKSVDYGSYVKEGTTLALIDSSLTEADLLRSRANVEQCRAQIVIAEAQKRAAEAQRTQAIAQVEQSKLNKKQADAKVVSAKADLEQALSREKLAINDRNRAAMLHKTEALGLASYESAISAAETATAAVAMARANVIEAEAATANADQNIILSELKVTQAEAEITQTIGQISLQNANLDAAMASYKREQQNMDYCIIQSPVDGIVIDRRVNIGQTVVSSMSAPSLFLIAKDLRKMQVWASVNEADIGQIRPGVVVDFSIDAFPDSVFHGVVGKVRLNASLSQNVVTYVVEIQTDNSDLVLLPYLTANVKFIIAKETQTLSVTNAALRWEPSAEEVDEAYRNKIDVPSEKGKGIVWKIDGEKLVPVDVTTSITDGICTGITSGLSKDDVIVNGIEILAENAPAEQTGGSPFMPKMKPRVKK